MNPANSTPAPDPLFDELKRTVTSYKETAIALRLAQIPEQLKFTLSSVLEATFPKGSYDDPEADKPADIYDKGIPSDWHLEPNDRPFIRASDGTLRRVGTGRDHLPAIPPWPAFWSDPAMDKWLDILQYVRTFDFAHEWKGWRFRVHAQISHMSDAIGVSLMVRRVPRGLPPGLIFPPKFVELLRQPSGLVPISGSTGSGKSTSLTRVISHEIPDDGRHIITYENPIEYRHRSTDRKLIRQFELGRDFSTFAEALGVCSMRTDPETIVPAELRDDESIKAAIEASLTGHLVIGTMHLTTASSVLSRVMLDGANRTYLDKVAGNLTGVLCQKLVPVSTGGRMAAFEFLLVDKSVRTLLISACEEGANTAKVSLSLEAVLTSNGISSGSFCFEHSLAAMVIQNRITRETAQKHAVRPELFATDFERFAQQARVARLPELYTGKAC